MHQIELRETRINPPTNTLVDPPVKLDLLQLFVMHDINMCVLRKEVHLSRIIKTFRVFTCLTHLYLSASIVSNNAANQTEGKGHCILK